MTKATAIISTGIFLFITLVAFSAPATAGVRVSPLLLDIEATGPRRSTRVKITNETLAPLPIEVSVFERSFGVDGAETERPADESFLIFPPQAVLTPGGSQTVRVEWIGDAPVDLTRYFALHIDQPPVALSQTPQSPGSGLSFVVSFVAHIYVSARDAKPALVVDEGQGISPAKSDTPAAATFRIRNDGDRYALLQRVKQLRVVCGVGDGSGGMVDTFRGENLPDVIGSTLVRAQESREFSLPLSASMADCARPGVVIDR